MIDDSDNEVSRLRRDARRWVTQLTSGDATTADADDLRRWRLQSSAHEAAYAEAIRLWKSLGPGGSAFVAKHGRPIWPAMQPAISRRMILGGGAALAAAAASYAVVAPPFDLWPSFDEIRADFRTATGEQRRLTVADVIVHMDTQTSLAIAGERGDVEQVRLITGEASFAMSPQSPKPLMVIAGSGRTVASQARFDIRNIASKVCVTCVDGRVQVEQGAQATIVEANQQVVYDAHGLGQPVVVDTGEATSWQDGFLVFRYTPLAAAIAEINRYRPGKIIVLGTALSAKPISGRFRIERTNEILNWIERAVGAKSRSLPGGIVLLS